MKRRLRNGRQRWELVLRRHLLIDNGKYLFNLHLRHRLILSPLQLY